MDALQAYHSSDSEEENSPCPMPSRSQNAVEKVDESLPSSLGAKLPLPNLDFDSSKRHKENSKESRLHPLLPWSRPPKRSKTHHVHRQLCHQNPALVVNGDEVARTSFEKSLSSAKCLTLPTASSGALLPQSRDRTYHAMSEIARHPDVSSKRLSVAQPYIPKRLRQSSPKSSRDLHSMQTEAAQEKLKETMYVTQPMIAYQLERHTTSKLPKHRTLRLLSHTGPVTHVRWCSASQFSHLLLSSSMDETVRIWNGISKVGGCLQTLNCHRGAVKDAQWGEGGRCVLSCGFDKTARLCDAESGKELQIFDHSSYVSCAKTKPDDPSVFITGTYNSSIFCWDIRTGNREHEYRGKLGQILDVEFLPDCQEFASSCDVVSRDSANKTIMVWDLRTTAAVSNQLYHEKYTCPCLRAHPSDRVFVAQSTANYIALFSTVRPYKLNKFKRYEGHQLEGYHIGCDFSPDGALLVSGSSDGKVYIYDNHTARILKTLQCHSGPCTEVAWHPVLPGVMASCSWDGTVDVWQ
ncbi:WD repeat-containing protein 25-like isoform X2 [Patiria miniata]|nr:WD repeat-containing protein 25-like isoform X2 [Patiria miniata]XP_038078409.1 WD repeat-containing protein 25-like isoform X2 [Patiria miniata]XP_038078410.1 WD repeat-containing protein 25-like isoform X2 [Patiria miniata]